MRFLLAFGILSLMIYLPAIILIAIIAGLSKHAKEKYGEPTREERIAYDLKQIRYNLEDLNAKKDIEIWKKK